MPALQLTADDHLSRRIDAVDLKHRLGDVETDCRDRLHVWLPITATAPAAITQWHLRAGGGAVHSIKSGRAGAVRTETSDLRDAPCMPKISAHTTGAKELTGEVHREIGHGQQNGYVNAR